MSGGLTEEDVNSIISGLNIMVWHAQNVRVASAHGDGYQRGKVAGLRAAIEEIGLKLVERAQSEEERKGETANG